MKNNLTQSREAAKKNITQRYKDTKLAAFGAKRQLDVESAPAARGCIFVPLYLCVKPLSFLRAFAASREAFLAGRGATP
jgi:hypothetical protein